MGRAVSDLLLILYFLMNEFLLFFQSLQFEFNFDDFDDFRI